MPTASASFSEQELTEAMLSVGGVNCAAVAQDPKLYKATFDLLKAAQQGKYVAAGAAVASFASTGAKHAEVSRATKHLTSAASAALSTMKVTMDMSKALALTSPGAVLAYVGAATVQKLGTSLSLVGSDQEKAKCLGAALELAGAAGTTALALPTGWLAVLTAASLVASSVNTAQACAPLLK